MTPLAVLAVRTHTGLIHLWGRYKCWHGLHDWTNAHMRGEKPTPEQLERGTEGFIEYQHTTCTRCPRVRAMSLQLKIDIGVATPADYTAEINLLKKQTLSAWRWNLLMVLLNFALAIPSLMDVHPVALINMAAAGVCWHSMRTAGKSYMKLKKMRGGQ